MENVFVRRTETTDIEEIYELVKDYAGDVFPLFGDVSLYSLIEQSLITMVAIGPENKIVAFLSLNNEPPNGYTSEFVEYFDSTYDYPEFTV